MKLFEYGGYGVYEFELKHLPQIWGIMRSCDNLFPDTTINVLGNVTLFAAWFMRTVNDALTIVVDNKVVGVSYLTDFYPNHRANIHIAVAKEYRNQPVVFALSQFGMGYFFKKYNLIKLQGLLYTGDDKRINFVKRIGMTIDGVLKVHALHNGVFTDYFIASITRDRYEDLHKDNTGHGDS